MKLFRRFWPLILLALLPAIPLWRCLLLGEAIGPFDQIRHMAPWNGPAPRQPWDVLQADGVLQFYPWRDMVFKAWGQGQLPLWNPYELAGAPLLANSQSAGLYPPHVVMGLLHVPTTLAILLLAWFHLCWAGLGTYLLARRFGASKQGAFVAGSSFELSVFMLAWTGLPSVISTVAWIPWLLATTCAVFQEPSGWRAPAQTRWAVLAALSTAMMLLAGHLQFAAYGLFGSAVLAIWMLFGKGRPDLALGTRVILAWVLGAMVAAPQLLPVLSYGQFSHRKNTPTAEGYQAYLAGAVKPFELANLTHAYMLGSPRTPVDVEGGTISAYWPAVAKPGANLAESAITLGPFVLGLLFLVPWRDRRHWPLACIGLLALLIALGTALNWPLYYLVPGWSSTGSPGRIVALLVLVSCVLAGIGFDAADLDGKPVRRWAIAVPFIAFLLCFLLTHAAVPEGADAVRDLAQQAASSAAVQTLAMAALAAGCIAVLLLPKAARYRRTLLLAPVVLALPYAFNLLMSGEPIPVQTPADYSRIAILNDDWPLLTVPHALAPPNTAYLLGFHEIGGYDSLLHRDTKGLLDAINGGDSAPPSNGNMMLIKHTASATSLGDAGVTGVWSLTAGRKPIAGRPRASVDGKAAEIESESFAGISVRANGPGRLTLLDRNMPGWLVKVDGLHAPVQGSVWREVFLPQGTHHVVFSYVPPGFMAGVGLALPALLLLILVAYSVRPKRREEPTT